MKLQKLGLLICTLNLMAACAPNGQNFATVDESTAANEAVAPVENPQTETMQAYGQLANAYLVIPSNAVADIPIQIVVQGKGYPISSLSSPEALKFLSGLASSTKDPAKSYRLPIVIRYVLNKEACTGFCPPGFQVFKVIVLNAGLPGA